eukprot:Awhi_evm2s12930
MGNDTERKYICQYDGCDKRYINEHSRRQHHRRAHNHRRKNTQSKKAIQAIKEKQTYHIAAKISEEQVTLKSQDLSRGFVKSSKHYPQSHHSPYSKGASSSIVNESTVARSVATKGFPNNSRNYLVSQPLPLTYTQNRPSLGIPAIYESFQGSSLSESFEHAENHFYQKHPSEFGQRQRNNTISSDRPKMYETNYDQDKHIHEPFTPHPAIKHTILQTESRKRSMSLNHSTYIHRQSCYPHHSTLESHSYAADVQRPVQGEEFFCNNNKQAPRRLSFQSTNVTPLSQVYHTFIPSKKQYEPVAHSKSYTDIRESTEFEGDGNNGRKTEKFKKKSLPPHRIE